MMERISWGAIFGESSEAHHKRAAVSCHVPAQRLAALIAHAIRHERTARRAKRERFHSEKHGTRLIIDEMKRAPPRFAPLCKNGIENTHDGFLLLMR